MFELTGKVAVVTGASRGIGRAIAVRLASQGALVCAAARGDNARETAGAIAAAGGRAEAYALDVTDGASVDALFEAVTAQHGRVDVLVNNAGITRDQLMLRMKRQDWDVVLDTNLTGAFACVQGVLKAMVRQRAGRIVSISSVVGQMGNAGQANYAASKAGLIGFSKSLAREVASRNITVNVRGPRAHRHRHDEGADGQGPDGLVGADSRGSYRIAGRRRRRGVLPGVRRGIVYYGAGARGQRRNVH